MLAHLPTLHPSIPLLLKGPTGAQPFFQRARAAGIPLTEDSSDGLAAGFDQWLRREVRELASPLGREFFGSGIQVEVVTDFNSAKDTYPYLDVDDNLANPGQFTGSEPGAYAAARSGDFGVIAIRVDIENLYRGTPRQRILSRKVLAIDKKHPGAGEAICNYLAHHIPCYTPMQAHNTALSFDRYGEGGTGTDEERIRNGVERVINEESPSDEDIAALRAMPLPEQMSYLSEQAGMVFKVDFDCPEYALAYKKPDPEKLPPKLRKHAISAGPRISHDAEFFNYMRHDLASLLLLRWNDGANCPTIRMFDDEINSEMEAGESSCDIAAIWVFGHETPSQFRNAAQRCAAWLRHLYRFAPLIDAVTDPSK